MRHRFGLKKQLAAQPVRISGRPPRSPAEVASLLAQPEDRLVSSLGDGDERRWRLYGLAGALVIICTLIGVFFLSG